MFFNYLAGNEKKAPYSGQNRLSGDGPLDPVSTLCEIDYKSNDHNFLFQFCCLGEDQKLETCTKEKAYTCNCYQVVEGGGAGDFIDLQHCIFWSKGRNVCLFL